MIANYEWVTGPFQNILEELSTAEEEIFLGFAPSDKIKIQFSNKSLFEISAGVYAEFTALKTKALSILLQFLTSYFCETGFSTAAA